MDGPTITTSTITIGATQHHLLTLRLSNVGIYGGVCSTYCYDIVLSFPPLCHLEYPLGHVMRVLHCDPCNATLYSLLIAGGCVPEVRPILRCR